MISAFAACLLMLPGGAGAQPADDAIGLPDVGQLAGWVVDGADRRQALMSVAVLARLRQRLQAGGSNASPDSLRQDLAWLERLAAHFGQPEPSGPVLDPATWYVNLKLDQHGLQHSPLVATGGAGLDAYLDEVFSRSEERLAAALLPELLWHVEPLATVVWNDLLQQSAEDGALRSLLLWVVDEWLGFSGQETGLPVGADLLALAGDSLHVMAEVAVSSGPPDPLRLKSIRQTLLVAIPDMDPGERQEAAAFLRLATLVDGLHERRYFAFTNGLLSVVAELLDRFADEPGAPSRVGSWLANHLPGISANYSRAFAAVDPRLNSAVAAAFDVLQNMLRGSPDRVPSGELRKQLADAAAQLALLIPDLAFYFELPVRDPIAGELDACTAMMARRDIDGSPAMTRVLYDDCQESLVALADQESRAPAIAGDPDGPFGTTQLQRELSVTAGQRINYGIGYLHERYSTGCEAPSRPLPNPLEWATLATLMAWFAEQSPLYFQTPENEARLLRMRAIGFDMLHTVAEQVDCFSGSGATVNDPVSRSIVVYREALAALNTGLDRAVQGFRQRLLAPGADIALQLDATQPTAYRPVDLPIGPCDPENICEMTQNLSSTRALLGLFPDTYLVADQAGFGNIEICYQNMQWVERRSEAVRAGDTNVANYYGHLAFDLVGRHVRDGSSSEVFGFRFTSPGEHHYLFAAATDEVLEDSCPMEWIGSRIVTPLRESRGGIVPNRLTYLAAPRMLPSRLLSNNWDRGAEWRDWFITGIGVESLALEQPADISSEVTQFLQSLYRAEQAAVYDSMLRPESGRDDFEIESQFEEVMALSTAKAMIRTQIMLFYPQELTRSDEIRGAVAGQAGLPDESVLARSREAGVPVSSIVANAVQQLDRFEAEWRRQAEATLRGGSVASSLAHALMRLNALYQSYFAPPPVSGGGAAVSLGAAAAGD
jgi:hypothetical protein